MRVFFVYATGIVALWLFVVFASGLWSNLAASVLVVIGCELWLSQQRAGALAILLIVSFLLDLTSAHAVPVALMTSTLTVASYLTLIEPLLVATTATGRFLTIVVWLTLWRLWYVAVVLLNLTLTHQTISLSPAAILMVWAYWLGGGLAAWLLWQLMQRTLKRYAKT